MTEVFTCEECHKEIEFQDSLCADCVELSESVKPCPRCGGRQIPYIYGMPREDDFGKEAIFVGCVFTIDESMEKGWCEECQYVELSDGRFEFKPKEVKDSDI